MDSSYRFDVFEFIAESSKVLRSRHLSRRVTAPFLSAFSRVFTQDCNAADRMFGREKFTSIVQFIVLAMEK